MKQTTFCLKLFHECFSKKFTVFNPNLFSAADVAGSGQKGLVSHHDDRVLHEDAVGKTLVGIDHVHFQTQASEK